ncbi:hydroxymethylbilane synthase [Hyphomicrobium sp. CS1BSMeth3]|uniref:hydroxymethylbilane synthase n=1 Tax=Hyphomicrobium sp. CS1BSMeth3 TaxID=1892844 RepID=UPI0009310D95|nr:hydroxymethylbilane synthase [Hyphomicrobium sp. CS1BSMeth3]
MQQPRLRIGTRGSGLALAQAHEVQRRLMAAHGFAEAEIEIVVIRTSGDRIQDRPLSEAGGKGLFTKEIEEGLLDKSIDLAVHSMKDMPTVLPEGLTIAAMLPREDVRDAFISVKWASIDALPQGAVVGSSSLRRQAQLRRLRPDLQVITYRGNVETRLKKLADGVVDATLLAVAGLKRLGLADRITAVIPDDAMLPAVAQGAIGIECRFDDEDTTALLAPLNDAATSLCVTAERAFLNRLEGSCRTPIAGLGRLDGGTFTFRGEILTPDGREHHATSRSGAPAAAVQLATEAAEELLSRAGPDFFGAHG